MKNKIITTGFILFLVLTIISDIFIVVTKRKQITDEQAYIAQQFNLAAETFSLCDDYGEYIQAVSYLYSASNCLITFDDRETSDKIVFNRLWQYAAAYPDNIRKNSDKIVTAMRAANAALMQGKNKKQALAELDAVYDSIIFILEVCVNE